MAVFTYYLPFSKARSPSYFCSTTASTAASPIHRPRRLAAILALLHSAFLSRPPTASYYKTLPLPLLADGSSSASTPPPLEPPLNPPSRGLENLNLFAPNKTQQTHANASMATPSLHSSSLEYCDFEYPMDCTICHEALVRHHTVDKKRSETMQHVAGAGLGHMHVGAAGPSSSVAFSSKRATPPVTSSNNNNNTPAPFPDIAAVDLGHIAMRLSACSHVFGLTCLATWLRNSNTCPLCRAELYVLPTRAMLRARLEEILADVEQVHGSAKSDEIRDVASRIHDLQLEAFMVPLVQWLAIGRVPGWTQGRGIFGEGTMIVELRDLVWGDSDEHEHEHDEGELDGSDGEEIEIVEMMSDEDDEIPLDVDAQIPFHVDYE
ncbi:hypothetical protein BDV95DRAFT_611241 [Massariosphaeria phaeospora]|uniref:RING-type domain-containing protein n=1 Tax=Massariosphaeria phaeospora TaxID=100035 RepID=A0A7C8I4I6_9PLEO|nr:hypothetical protein BDV95DRAFT_611241 [Massariosphaeria phaeospora]